MKLLAILMMLSIILGFAAPVLAQTASQKSLLDNLAGNRDFSTLANAAKVAGLDGLLSGSTPYTLFAPNNAAFNKIPQGSINALLNDKAKLGGLLRHHVVPGKITYADLAGRTSITAADGNALPVVRHADGSITVGGAKVQGQGIESRNGMIYPIDSVVTPPGFAMPQAPAAPAMNWNWLPWLVGALAVLGGLALYLLTRKKRHYEAGTRYEPARARYEEKPRYEERARYEEAKRPEETMRQVRESTTTYKEPEHRETVHKEVTHREPEIADIAKNVSLPLSGDATKGLNMLIDRGDFKSKSDFMDFLAKTYKQNDVGSMMSEGVDPHESRVLDIIHKSGIARNFFDTDIKKYLVPLFIAGFRAIHDYTMKRPAGKAM